MCLFKSFRHWSAGLGLLAFATAPGAAALDVFACEPEWGALATELGGERVDVYTATTAHQDPHFLQARPSLIAKVRHANMVVCTGAELEIGWLPALLRRANNPAVQPGKPGYFEASDYIAMRDVPEIVDRARGDVHTEGNPHIQTDPRNIARVAQALSERLAQIDADNADFYAQRYEAFAKRWQAAIERWEKRAEPLRGMPIVIHHKSWTYLTHWLGLEVVAELEPLPGVQPSVSHLQIVLKKIEANPAAAIIRTPYYDDRASKWLSERSGIPAIVLPFTVGGTEAADDLFGLFQDTIERLLAAQAGSA